MKKEAVLSATGRDRVGVADDLGELLASRRIVIEDSRMTSLRGRFALLAQVGGSQADVSNLLLDLSNVAKQLGYDLKLEPLEHVDSTKRTPKLVIESFSSNPAGLNVVTGFLKQHEINIEELQTETSDGPFNSRPTHYMKVRVETSTNCSADILKSGLRELQRDRDLDIMVKEEHDRIED